MRDWLIKAVSLAFLIFIFVYLFARFAPGIPVSSVTTTKVDQFTVEGTGKVTVVPDTALVNLGISVTKPTVKDAQAEANKVINSTGEDLKSMGVDKKDIETSNYSIYPQYDYSAGRNRITGYNVNANLTITVRDLTKVNEVIDSATANGANTVGGISLTINEDRRKELLKEAREKAVAEAKTKAETLASAAGISLGRIINIQESQASYPLPYDRMSMAKSVMPLEGAGGAGDTNIEPGSTDISTTIILSYETR